MPAIFAHPQEVEAAMDRVETSFAGQVDPINFNFGENLFGDPSIFFRVVVRNEVVANSAFSDVMEKVAIALMNEANTDDKGVYTYFDGRPAGEVEPHDPVWA